MVPGAWSERHQDRPVGVSEVARMPQCGQTATVITNQLAVGSLSAE